MEVDFLNVAVAFLTDLDIYVVAVYRLPSYSDLQDENLLLFLVSFVLVEVLLLGDFFLPSLDWRLEVRGYARPRKLLFIF